MKIACLGWGSLIWNPQKFEKQLKAKDWNSDGPLAPIEFARQSNNGRITLVIEPTAVPVKLLWNIMTTTDLKSARDALGDREGIHPSQWESLIGTWERGNQEPELIQNLSQWATKQDLDAVVWTALGPKFNNRNTLPSIEQVLEYLNGLTGDKCIKSKEYIECAPQQIDTEYRRQIKADLRWGC